MLRLEKLVIDVFFMETLKARIQKDLTASLKQRDATRVSTLRMVLSALNYAFIEKGSDLVEADELKVVQGEAKKRRESIAAYQETRPELADQEKMELLILEEYLPAQMADEDIQKVIDEVMATADVSQLNAGRVTGMVMKQLVGKNVEGSLVKELVEKSFEKGL